MSAIEQNNVLPFSRPAEPELDYTDPKVTERERDLTGETLAEIERMIQITVEKQLHHAERANELAERFYRLKEARDGAAYDHGLAIQIHACAKRDRPHTRAEAFLVDLLRYGPMPGNYIADVATERGIAMEDVYFARDALGIDCGRYGQLAGYWKLSDEFDFQGEIDRGSALCEEAMPDKCAAARVGHAVDYAVDQPPF